MARKVRVSIDLQPCVKCGDPAPGIRGEARYCERCAYQRASPLAGDPTKEEAKT